MSGLVFILTPLGRARLIDPENTGTSGLRISHIGVSSSAAGVVGGVLQGEIKRLTTFAGQVVADDTIHVTVRDDTSQVYTLRSFALYFEDGALMGWYAQPAVILEKSEQAMLLLSGDIQFQNLNVTALTFGDSNWTNPIATTTVFGVLRLATPEVALAGNSVVDAITPAGLLSVLNARFGAGAPSAFVKPLLALASAALIRGALELGNASVRNEGAGNGLDADLLDGQHGAYYRDWANLQNKPVAFPPSAHGHNWGDLSGVPSTATRWPTFAEVTDKPASYPPSAHTHAAADVTTGVFVVDRIPDLAQAKVTGLVNALASKAPINAPQFTGGISMTGTAKIHDPGTGSVVVDIGAGYSNATDGHAFIANRQPHGFIELFALNGGSRLRVQATGVTWNDNLMWHVGNFNPTTKANLSADSVGHIRLTGNGNAYYITDRTSLRDWATYASGDKFIVWGGTSDVAWFGPSGYLHLLDYLRAPTVNVGAISPLTTEGFQFVWNVASPGNGRNEYINNHGAGDGGHFFYRRASTAAGLTVLAAITPSGQIQAVGGFRNTSSARTKNIDGPLPYGLDELSRLAPVIGCYKPEYFDDGGKKRLFLIAENVANVMPEPVDLEGVEFGDERVPDMDYMQLVPVLVNGVNQLHSLVKHLRAEIDALKSGAT